MGESGEDDGSIGVAVVSVSADRSLDEDPPGAAIRSELEESGYEVVTREVIEEKYDNVQGTVDRLVRRDDVALIVTNGGTGVRPDETTIEAIRSLTWRDLPGFGERFRRYWGEEVGVEVIGDRSTAGIIDDTPIFCLPGDERAARFGTSQIIIPVARDLIGALESDQ